MASNIKEVHGKPRLFVTYFLEYGRHVARLRRRRRRRRAFAPTSNTACHDNHEKINSWVSFAFLYVFEYGAPLLNLHEFAFDRQNMKIAVNMLFSCILYCEPVPASIRTVCKYSR